MTKHSLDSMKEIQQELAERRIEAVRLYRPMPKQDEFHKCMASERIVIGGNRCLAGDQSVWDPVAKLHRIVSEISGPFWVDSLINGKRVPAQADRPFIKAKDALYSFHLNTGAEIRCTLNHLVLSSDGQWIDLRAALTPECVADLQASTSGISQPESPEGDLRWCQTPEGFRAYCRSERRSCDGLPLSEEGADQASPRQSGDAHRYSRSSWRPDDQVDTPERSLVCPGSDRPSSTGVLDRPSGHGGASQNPIVCTPCSQPWNCGPAVVLSRPLFCAPPRTTCAFAPLANRSCCVVPYESPECGNEHVYITAYKYLGEGDVWDFEVPETHNYIIGGLPNHNSGKSMATFVEDARAATGQDPYNKYPKENGNLVIIGRNWQHVGMVVYPMLFKAGAFKIIRDETTGKWRAFIPGEDDHRSKEAKPAPPLIPPRMIKDMAWVQKNAGYLNKAELINGWTIFCFSSEGEPPQGFQADLVHIDEDISLERWVGEMQARLADRKGRFVWSAMPHSKNDALLGLCERADKAETDPDAIIKKFTLRFLDNAHIDEKEKKKNIERWSALGMDELRMRAEGEFTTESTLMYPTFNPAVHILKREEIPDGQVPLDWTRYVAIDPGHAVMACVFAAVPPDERFLLVYDELYIRQCNALIFGEQFFAKAQNQHFYTYIMDMHGGMLRDLGSGRLPHELYSEELKKRNCRSQVSAFGFTPGSDDIPARTAMVRKMLHIRGDGTTQLKILDGSCPNLLRELKRYRKKTTTVNGQVYVTDEPQTRGEVHACQALEYLCAYEPKYHKPPRVIGPEPWWVKYLADKRRRQMKDDDGALYLSPKGKYQ